MVIGAVQAVPSIAGFNVAAISPATVSPVTVSKPPAIPPAPAQNFGMWDDRKFEEKKAFQLISPLIVRIEADDDDVKWYGSGTIVEPSDIIPEYMAGFGEYFIITNDHVARSAKYLSAKFGNGYERSVEVVESPYGTPLSDPVMDTALLRVFLPLRMDTAPIGDPKKLEIGDRAYTAGHTRVLPNIVITSGEVTQPQQETGAYSLDIQSDAPISPGNSGGPLFVIKDGRAQIVGTNTYVFRESEDLTFSKPIDAQREALQTLYRNGIIIRGDLKFKVAPLSLIDRQKSGLNEDMTGAVVKEVPKGSKAELAGLKPGDIITGIEVRENGYAANFLDLDIKDFYEAEGVLKRWAEKLTPGTKVTLTVFRPKGDGECTTLEIETEVEML